MKVRNTIQKSMISEALMNLNHPSAEQVFEEVSKRYPNISKATVYRNLNQMAQNGELMKISVPDGADHYDTFTEEHHHAHCKMCGKVIDVEAEKTLDDIMRSLKNSYGFDVQEANIIFSGICADCKNSGKFN